jgi:hypothetical protein
MKDIILALMTIATMLLGFLVMRRLDGYFQRRGTLGEAPVLSRAGILLFGQGALIVALGALLQDKDIGYVALCGDHIPSGAAFTVAVALSDSDLDNLLFCANVRRHYAGVPVLARCNDYVYRDVYASVGAERVYDKNVRPEAILSELEAFV